MITYSFKKDFFVHSWQVLSIVVFIQRCLHNTQADVTEKFYHGSNKSADHCVTEIKVKFFYICYFKIENIALLQKWKQDYHEHGYIVCSSFIMWNSSLKSYIRSTDNRTYSWSLTLYNLLEEFNVTKIFINISFCDMACHCSSGD